MKCSRCPAEAGRFKRCQACRRACNVIQQRWRQRNPRHAARLNRESYQRSVEAGKCTRCGSPSVSASACQECLDYVAARYEAKRPSKRAPRTCNRCRGTDHIASNHRCPARFKPDVTIEDLALARNAA